MDMFGGPRRLDRLAQRLLSEAGRELRAACRRLDPPIAVELEPLEESWAPKAGYRLPGELPPGLRAAQLPFVLRPLVALAPGHPMPLRVEAAPYGLHLDAGVDEIYPEASLSLLHRLRPWTETLAAALVAESLR